MSLDPKRRELFEKEARKYAADNRDYFDSDGVPVDEVYLAGREAAEQEIENIYALLKEICDEWNEGCDPNCDSYGHEETCKSVNIAQAKKALKQDIERKNEIIQDLTNLVSKNHQEIEKLQALIAAKDEALEFYAQIDWAAEDLYPSPDKAREALKLNPEQAQKGKKL